MPARTELIWEGKYDAQHRRNPPFRVALPFQTIETVNESAQERTRSLFAGVDAEQPWRNRLIWGDRKYVLPSLLPEFAGQVNLIYIDPPFDTGADFSFTASVPAAPDPDADDAAAQLTFEKQPSLIEQKAYRDTWGRGLDSYLQWFYETAVLLHELLAEDGSIYVHLDWHVGHYAKCVLDEVFGIDCFLNEITWQRTGAHNDPRRYGNVSDSILYYSKTSDYTWNTQFTEYGDEYIQERFRSIEEGTGRRYWLNTLTAPAHGRPAKAAAFFGKQRMPPAGTMWRFTQDKIVELENANRIVATSSGMPYIKQYLDESKGRPIQNVWSDIPMSKSGLERTGYATQKPEALLDRILRASSNEGDLVLDCFSGSGTTAAVAEKLQRRWIACDLGRFAIHTARKRLLAVPDVRPFVVQNLGKYERQLWHADAFAADDAAARQRKYVAFVLQLYHATPLAGGVWIHGSKNGRLVHVGGVEAPVTAGDVKQIVAEYRKRVGSGAGAPTVNGVDVLGWEFAFEMNEVARQQATAANVQLAFKRIPRDAMDKRAVAEGDVKFFELAALAVEAKARKRTLTLTLSGFVIPPDDVPEEVRAAVTHWSQWVDYWAVDWDYRGDTFHNAWQTFRSRKGAAKLELSAAQTYAEPGEYRVVVKAIDILGNDTTKTLAVVVK